MNVCEAQSYLTETGGRVELAHTAASMQADLRLAIEKERQLELAFEGSRWFAWQRAGVHLRLCKTLKKQIINH